MGVQFERVTQASSQSLTLIVDDLHQAGPSGSSRGFPNMIDPGAWLNALHRQSIPLISSRAGQANLLAWLDALEDLSATDAGH